MSNIQDKIFTHIKQLITTAPVFTTTLDESVKDISGLDLKHLWKYHCSLSNIFKLKYCGKYSIFNWLENISTIVDEIDENYIDTTFVGDTNYIDFYNKHKLFSTIFDSHITSTNPHLTVYFANKKIFVQYHNDKLLYDQYQIAKSENDVSKLYYLYNKMPFWMFEGDIEDFTNINIPIDFKNDSTDKIIILCYV
jgi:hypothetical protein